MMNLIQDTTGLINCKNCIAGKCDDCKIEKCLCSVEDHPNRIIKRNYNLEELTMMVKQCISRESFDKSGKTFNVLLDTVILDTGLEKTTYRELFRKALHLRLTTEKKERQTFDMLYFRLGEIRMKKLRVLFDIDNIKDFRNKLNDAEVECWYKCNSAINMLRNTQYGDVQ